MLPSLILLHPYEVNLELSCCKGRLRITQHTVMGGRLLNDPLNTCGALKTHTNKFKTTKYCLYYYQINLRIFMRYSVYICMFLVLIIKPCCFHIFKSRRRRCSVKNVFLNISQSSPETPVPESLVFR